MPQNLKIKSDGTGLNTKVYVNGEELKMVKSITFNCLKPATPLIATLEVYVDELDLDMIAEHTYKTVKAE